MGLCLLPNSKLPNSKLASHKQKSESQHARLEAWETWVWIAAQLAEFMVWVPNSCPVLQALVPYYSSILPCYPSHSPVLAPISLPWSWSPSHTYYSFLLHISVCVWGGGNTDFLALLSALSLVVDQEEIKKSLCCWKGFWAGWRQRFSSSTAARVALNWEMRDQGPPGVGWR